jgi:cytidylate kinase
MPGPNYAPLVTVSATYGTGGSIIAPRLAEILGLPYVDRLITPDMSEEAARGERTLRAARSEEGLSEGEEETTPAGRFLSYFARAASVGVVMTPDAVLDDDDTLRQRTEKGVRDLAAGAPGVLLGRAGAVVMRSRPRAYHVRLDGPVERRVAWVASHENIGVEVAQRRQAETDRARTLFVKRLFRTDPSDARLYHLVLDTTVLGIDRSLEVLTVAVRAFFANNPAGP